MRSIFIAGVILCISLVPVSAQIAVATYHYNNGRTGWDANETTLTPANVGGLGVRATVTLDERVDTQPLVVPKDNHRRPNARHI
jgi:hypothetical protein